MPVKSNDGEVNIVVPPSTSELPATLSVRKQLPDPSKSFGGSPRLPAAGIPAFHCPSVAFPDTVHPVVDWKSNAATGRIAVAAIDE